MCVPGSIDRCVGTLDYCMFGFGVTSFSLEYKFAEASVSMLVSLLTGPPIAQPLPAHEWINRKVPRLMQTHLHAKNLFEITIGEL